MKFRHFFTMIVLVAVVIPRSWAGTQPIVTTDLLRIRSVSSIDVSRDGLKAVFAVRSIATVPPENPSDPAAEPTYRYESHLFLLDLAAASATPRQLTFGERADNSPRFSPDGKRIAFVREAPSKSAANPNVNSAPHHESESAPQIWIIPVDGGEAQQVTDFKNGCVNPYWSPDARRLLVSSQLKFDEIEGVPVWPTERPKRAWRDAGDEKTITPAPAGSREQIRAWLERNANRTNPNVITRLEFQEEHALRSGMRFTHLFLIDPESASLPVNQEAARRITNGFFDYTSPCFMPDGRSIVYVSKKQTERHPDRVLATNIWRINIDGSNDHMILGMDGWSLGNPKPSSDGAALAFTGQMIDEPAFRQTQLGVASLKGETASDPIWLTDDANLQSSVDSYEWMHTQPALVFSAPLRGGFPLMTVSPGVVQPATIVSERDDRPVGVNVFGVGANVIVYAECSASNPCVLRVHDARGDRLAYDLNPWLAEKTISLPTAATLTRPDGVKVQWWLMEPTNRDPQKKYPLVLEVHGGPSAMWGPGEFTMWHEFQLLCSWGFGVVYANPRGSGGYGYEFQKKNFQDWGDGPGNDVLAAVDEAVLKDWVDRDRLLVTGGSYGGYLTAWIVSHDNRFKAAVAQRGVYDFSTFFGEGNAWRLVAWAMGGNPYDPRFKQALDRNNIFNFVTRIRTPLLIIHGSNDLRTGYSQSEMLYRALKEQNKPVEYVRYPDAGHDMSRTGDPAQRMDRLNRIIEFFERYVTNERPAPVASSN